MRKVQLLTIGTRVAPSCVLDDTSFGATYALKRAHINKAVSLKAIAANSGQEGTVELCADGAMIFGVLANVQPKDEVGAIVKSGYLRVPMTGLATKRFAKAWAADTVTTVGTVINPTAAADFSFIATARSGDFKTHATTEPTWPTALGDTVVDDVVTWTCIERIPTYTSWVADTVTALNAIVMPSTPDGYAYQAVAIGSGDHKTHATTEPTWPTTYGATIVDDQVTWQNIGVTGFLPTVGNTPSGVVIGGGSGAVKCCTLPAITVTELLNKPRKVVSVDHATMTCVIEMPADVL